MLTWGAIFNAVQRANMHQHAFVLDWDKGLQQIFFIIIFSISPNPEDSLEEYSSLYNKTPYLSELTILLARPIFTFNQNLFVMAPIKSFF
jgi:hypothetical protein